MTTAKAKARIKRKERRIANEILGWFAQDTGFKAFMQERVRQVLGELSRHGAIAVYPSGLIEPIVKSARNKEYKGFNYEYPLATFRIRPSYNPPSEVQSFYRGPEAEE